MDLERNVNNDPDNNEMHFIDEPISVIYEIPPALEKKPTCPDGFIWNEKPYRIVELLAEWQDYRRRGRFARNMRPAHADRAARAGSWGVGRFFFRVRVETGQVFEIYYDRAPTDVDDRKGSWVLYAERSPSIE